MLLILKRKSLTILPMVFVLVFSAEIVYACSYDTSNGGVDPTIENEFYSKIYFFSSILLISVIFVCYLLKNQKEIWLFIITMVPIILILPLLFMSALASDCGYWLRDSLGKTVIILIALSALHIISWRIQTNKSKSKLN